MSYWRLYYHIIWATYERQPLLDARTKDGIFEYIQNKITSLEGVFHAIGGIEDHVHLVVSIPPKIAIADFVQRIKGSSSHYINESRKDLAKFAWQHEYGVVSFSHNQLDQVTEYVLNQEQRHKSGDVHPIFERIDQDVR